MPSALDLRMDAGLAQLTAPGAPFALGTAQVCGQTLPLIAAAPPALPAYFAHFCAEHADKTFLVAGNERLTFAQTFAQAQAAARALVAVHGVAKGDRVGIAMRNSPSWIVLYMGIVMAGGIATLLNGWWQSEELATAIGDVGCSLVLADAPRAKRIAGMAGIVPPLVTIDDTLPIAQAMAAVGTAAGDTPLPALAGEDAATILFTSGSTGQSKGALSDHRAITQAVFNYLVSALVMVGIATEQGQAPTLQPATLLNVPLFHVTAEVPVFLQSFAMGRKLVLMPKWDAREAMRLIEAEQVTYFVGVPLMSFEILNHPERGRFDLSTVTDFAAGGAPRPVEHVRRIKEEMGGGSPLIGYGLTETNAAGSGNWRDNYLAKPDSAGRPSPPLMEFAILDDDGRHLLAGQLGEICIRSVANFREYWNNPAATAAAFTADGFFRSGDLGRMDEDGYIFIVDRKKDIIIRGGENISCLEVEAALYGHPAVAEAAVFGLPDERYGEVPGAVVRCRPSSLSSDACPDEAELQEFLRGHIAGFKVPARLWISTDPLPRLGTEKIDKVSLRNHYRALAAA